MSRKASLIRRQSIGMHRRAFSMTRRRSAVHRKAFSLIEITAVVLVLAIIAGSVTLRMAGTVQHARMGDVVGQIEQFDRLARLHARQHDRPLRLVVNMSAGTIKRTDPRGSDEPYPPLVMPDGYRLARLWVRGQAAESGGVSITCSRLGLTPSYALLLEGPAGQQKWLLATGLSGRFVEPNSDDQTRNILAAAAAPKALRVAVP
jgi:prepilin-type N-terminal cleavage/methylation domain-containing protein